MEKQIKNEEKYKKNRKKRNTVIETPIAIDLSADITKLFRVNTRKKQRVSEYMCESIIKTKLKADESARKGIYLTVPSRPATAEEFRDFTKQCPSTEMSRFQERDIRRKIQARGLEDRHPQLLADIMKETREEYTKIIKQACLNLKIKGCYPEAIYKIEPYKYLGKTNRYREYLLTRRQLKTRWILHYPIIRKIVTHCITNLPYELVHLKFEKTLDLNEIKYVLKDKAQSATQFVYEFYIEIAALIAREETKQKRRYAVSYLGACTGILSVQISRAIAHTILYIVKFTASKENSSYLNLYVTFKDGLILTPTPEEVIEAYYEFIQKIIDVSEEIYVFERNKVRSYRKKHIYLCLTEEFISQCKEEIKINIHKLYEPIVKYLNDLTTVFQRVYPDINSEHFLDSISDIEFEAGCEKIAYYKEYLSKVAYIPNYDYFHIGQMSLTNYRLELHGGLRANIEQIFEKLSSQHLWEVTDLCETFKLIHTKATLTPLTTEELVETGKYMSWIKDEHLSELELRVKSSIKSLCQIIELGILTEEHMELTSTAVKWLGKIMPVINEHFTNFEQLKFDAEEKLQKVVEDVTVAIKEVYPLLVILDDMDDISKVRSYLNQITLHMSKIKEIEAQISWINKEEVCLSFPKSTYAEYEDLKNYVFPFYHLLKMCLEVQRNVSVWQEGQFESLNYESTKTSVDNYYEELTQLYKSYRKKLRKAQDENLPVRFKGTVDDPDILNWPAPLKLCGKAMKLLDDFKPSVAIMKIICNNSLRKRHWKAMSEIAGQDITPNAGTTLKKITKVDFHSNLNEYEIISAGASKEKQLIDRLESLKVQWNDIVFTVSKYKETSVLTGLEDIEALIDDHSIQVLNMKSSVFVKPHEMEVKIFYDKILAIDRTIDKWDNLQRQWISLYPMFSTDHLSLIIPIEFESFNKVKHVYNTYIGKILEIQTVIKVVETTNILSDIDSCLTELEVIRHGVLAYLETTRETFPRFHFLADDELLEIISQESVLQSKAFLPKIFQGIHQLAISDSEIVGVQSLASETLKFADVIDLRDNSRRLEELCAQIEHQMVASLKYHVEECYNVYKRTILNDILLQFPQQVVQIVSQVYWTENIDSALRLTHNIKLRICNQKLENSLKEKMRMVNESNTQNLHRVMLKNLIVNDLNNKYVIQKILAVNRVNENLFEWEAQTRYYLQNGLCRVELMDTKQNYLYEYLGDYSLLILSPLTDRCYRTLINSHYLHFNGLLQGPSESGKSETIKGLTGALGVLFVSFYCPQKLNTFTLERFFKGSVLCGAWLCLENFNVLRSDVLSVISQDMCAILSALRSGGCQSFIGGVQVSVNPSGFICASMSSVRCNVELPENVKVLFRSMTLIAPDVGRIVEAILCSMGFKEAHNLSRKVLCLYETYQEMFPDQKYFNVSSLKQILQVCEQLKLKNVSDSEDYIVSNCIKSTVVHTLEQENVRTFVDVLEQIFPNTGMSVDEEILKDPFESYCEEHNLQVNKEYLAKVAEIFSCLKGKSHIILLGETFTGKTTALNICKHFFAKLESIPVVRHTVNPNCLSYEILYGQLNSNSHRWRDGVVSKIIRDFSQDKEISRRWLVFDGNIDDSWIENVSPILTGEEKFYLESGEVLDMKSASVIFEVKNLRASSPVTVSRCRMVYMDPSILTWRSFVKSWIDACESEWIQEYKQQILDILYWVIPPSLNFIDKHCTQLCYPNEINLVKNMIQLTQIIMDEAFLSIISKEEDVRNLTSWIQATLIQTGILGLGSVLDANSKYKFDEFYRLLWKGQNEDHPYPTSFEKLEVALPQDGLIFDYQYIYKQRGIWKLYQDVLKNEKIIEGSLLQEFVVPTVDTLRYNFLLTSLIENKHPTLLIGPSGTGKSLLIEDILINQLKEDEYEVGHINFNYNSNARQLQTFILSKLNKRKAGFYTPTTDKQFLLFIDNLNLLPVEKHETSGCVELLRQHLDHKVWYDFKSSNPIRLNNVNIISAMTVDSQKKLCQRFLRHFDIFSINEFSDDTLSRIYSNFLLHVWKKAGFPGDINTVVTHIVAATLCIYQSVIKKFKRTIRRPYYHFNLGDFTKAVRGCSRLKKETYDGNKKIYLKLWTHEILRIFGDRLEYLDASWLLDKIRQSIKEEFDEEIEDIFGKFDSSSQQNDPISKLVFGTLNDLERPENSRRYEEITDLSHLLDVVNEFLRDYNIWHDIKLDVTFASYALDKLMKICRVLSISSGNAWLLGLTGCGRQSLTKLAAFIYKQKLFQPTITQNYAAKDWNKDFKEVLREAGALENQCVLLISEEHLVDEQFLQNIDWLLRHGEIPYLYDTQEKQDILESARLSAQGGNRNLDISSSSVFLYFNKRCRENLHLILSLSVRDTLRIRIRNHPSLMNCHVIWFEDWPDEVLEVIGQTWIKDMKSLQEETKKDVVKTFVFFHRQSQLLANELRSNSKFHVHITSRSFKHLIKLFIELITNKQTEINALKARYQQGLTKLSYAANQIIRMQNALAEYQPQLEAMTQRAIEMTDQIALETIEVEKASDLVRKDEKIASEQASVAQILKSECESELAQAIPILEDAISALNTLKPTDITLVKSMKNPPDAIKLVMASVCVIKDVKPERLPDPSTGRKIIDYWGPSKRILGDMNFLQTLKDFDKDHIKPEIMAKIRKEYLPHKDFKPHVVAKASSAAEGLCKWIIAMDMYDKVAKEVAPKKEKLEKAEKEYAETVLILNEKKEEVARIEEKLAHLNDLLEEATQKQIKLQREVDYCNKKLHSAQNLIGSLSGEKIRWTEAVENLGIQYNALLGNVLICCGIIAYLAPFNNAARETITHKWHTFIKEGSLPCSEQFDMLKILGPETKTEFWLRNGLPQDHFFLVNAVIKEFSQYYSVFIDPQYLANSWIRHIERRNSLTVARFSHTDYLDQLGTCISAGKPILIENIKEYIPPCLNELLSKQIYIKDEEVFVKLSNEYIKLDKNFRLYMVSNLRTPYFTPPVYNRMTLINFTATEEGLEQHLLKIVTEVEKPELKKLKKELYSRNKKDAIELSQLEDRILSTLCESDSDILEDEASIKILDQSKDLVKIVREEQEETRQLQATISTFNSGYVSVAKYAASLFTCMYELRKINFLYEFSFDWYVDLYFRSVLKSEKSVDLDRRCENVKDCFTYELASNIIRSLFKKDQLIFLFLLTTRILLFKKQIRNEELVFFLSSKFAESETTYSNPAPQWISGEIWRNLCQIETLPEFEGFLKSFTDNISTWKNFFEQQKIELEHFPLPWNTKLDNFKKLILLKMLRIAHLYRNITKFVSIELGRPYVETRNLDLCDIYNESYSLSPILFISMHGTDPMRVISDLAAKKKVLNKFHSLSLGNDRIEAANDFFEEARKKGSWLLLQNCHLVPRLLLKLEQKVVEMDFENTHENFRLWLTAKPSEGIPMELLQASVKVIDEPHESLRENLMRLYKRDPIDDPSFYKGCPGRQEIFTKLLYGLSFFHCILQAKRKYGTIGWGAPYLFNDTDIDISLHQLQITVNDAAFTSKCFEKLNYIIGLCHYSGELDDQWDIRLLVTLLNDCLNTNMTKTSTYLFNNLKPYGLPAKKEYKDYLLHISNLPQDDLPEIFGLSEFVVAFSTVEKSNKLIASSLEMLTEATQKNIKDYEFYLSTVIDELLKKLPTPLHFTEVSENSILVNEIKHYNTLLAVITHSLQSLRQALAGDITITSKLEHMAERMIHNSVPEEWSHYSYPHKMNLSNYVENLCQRIQYFKNIDNLGVNRYWLAAFFFPKALICQAKLNFSKKLGIPLEHLAFDYEVLVNGVPKSNGIVLEGLHIMGAKWDNENATLAELSTNLYGDFPPVLLRPESIADYSEGNLYSCPIYQIEGSVTDGDFLVGTKNFISSVLLPTEVGPSHWIKRGVKMVCQVSS